MAGRIVEFRGATSSLGTKNRSRHWRSLAGRSRGVRHTRIIREPIKSAQRARGRFAREPLQQVLGLRVVGEAVDRYRHRVADKLIARLHEGVAPRLLAVLIWGTVLLMNGSFSHSATSWLRAWMSWMGTLKMSASFQSANKKVCSTTLLPCAPVTGASW